MAGERSSDRERRRRRGATPAARQAERARRNVTGAPGSGRRPGGQSAARPRPGSRSSTGGAFKLSSTRRAAVLALLVCAMALSVAVPLRTYLSQQRELANQQRREADVSQQVTELEQRRAELSDPAQVEAEARTRLGYVRPGETPYIVEVPDTPTPSTPALPQAAPQEAKPWYERLWTSMTGEGS